jgi:Dullard-like phosphatase family protein
MSDSVTTINLSSKDNKSEIILPTMNTPNELNNLSFPNDAANNINKEDETLNKIKEFYSESSKIYFPIINSNENFVGNYDNYITETLKGISKLNKLNFENALLDPQLYLNMNRNEITRNVVSGKKVVLLDLDETLIHGDFQEECLNDIDHPYDKIIKFTSLDEQEEVSVGIFIRNGVQKFLEEISKIFDIGIFTASSKDYADAVINYLDPNNEFIKFRLYRNSCIRVNNISIKDLRIIGVDLKNIVLIDNNMYSFANQLGNGILINSFYYDKNDYDLFSVMSYLLTYIAPSDDVRKINEMFFHFDDILKQIN